MTAGRSRRTRPRRPRGRHPLPDRERKDRLVQTRVPELLDETLREAARRGRITVSQLIRNVLENTFELVDDAIAGSAAVGRALANPTNVGRPERDPGAIGDAIADLSATIERDAQELAGTADRDARELARSTRELGGAVGRRGRDIGATVGQRGRDLGANVGRRGRDLGASVKRDAQHLGTTLGRSAKDLGAAVKRGAKRVGAAVRGEAEAPATPHDGGVVDRGDMLTAVDVTPRNTAVLEDVVAWQEVVANRPAMCARCRRYLRRGDRAFLGLCETAGPRPWLCAACGSSV